MRIRAATPADAAELAAIQEQASVAALGHVFDPERYPYPREAIAGRWRRAVADEAARVFVADDGGPVGVAFVEGEWLHGLYVLPARWGTGAAGPLHDAAVEHLRATGFPHAKLWVLEANARARRFYERRGWRENGETRIVEYPPNPLDVGYTLDF